MTEKTKWKTHATVHLRTRGHTMNRNELIKEAKALIQKTHRDITVLEVAPLREPPKHWYQYHGRNAIPFSNRWSFKTYPTGLRKKQIYLLVTTEGYHPSIYDATLEPDGRVWLSSMGRFLS